MGKKVRFYITWTFNRDHFAGPWHKIEDHLALVQIELLETFQGYRSAVCTTSEDMGGMRSRIRIVWDVEMDMFPGAWHTPDWHESHLNNALLAPFERSYDATLDVQMYEVANITDIDAIDHGLILKAAVAAGPSRPSRADYPVFRADSCAATPKTTTVFRQNGYWWWLKVDTDGKALPGERPTVGPAPSVMYTAYQGEMTMPLDKAA